MKTFLQNLYRKSIFLMVASLFVGLASCSVSGRYDMNYDGIYGHGSIGYGYGTPPPPRAPRPPRAPKPHKAPKPPKPEKPHKPHKHGSNHHKGEKNASYKPGHNGNRTSGHRSDSNRNHNNGGNHSNGNRAGGRR